jgi:hypothetical protein
MVVVVAMLTCTKATDLMNQLQQETVAVVG